MRYFSVHNPIFKKELLSSLIGHRLIGSRFYFVGDPKIADENYLNLPNNHCIIELEFSNGIKMDFSYWSPRYFEVKESSNSGEKCFKSPNKNRSIDIIGPLNGYVVNDINKIGGIESLKVIINNKEQIEDVQLIKQNLSKIQDPRYSNPLFVNGIHLVFNSKNIFIYHHKISALKFDNKCQEIENGEFVLSSEFIKYGQLNKGYLFGELLIPKINLKKEWITSRSELTASQIVDVYDIKKMKPNKELIQKIIQDHNIEQLKEHLTFFNLLKNDLTSKQYGIAELKFGVTSDSNFKLITPIDVVEPLAENIMFIDNIIEIVDGIKSSKYK